MRSKNFAGGVALLDGHDFEAKGRLDDLLVSAVDGHTQALGEEWILDLLDLVLEGENTVAASLVRERAHQLDGLDR